VQPTAGMILRFAQNDARHWDKKDGEQFVVCSIYELDGAHRCPIAIELVDERGQRVPGTFNVKPRLVFADNLAERVPLVPVKNKVTKQKQLEPPLKCVREVVTLKNGLGVVETRIVASSHTVGRRDFKIEYGPADDEIAAKFRGLTCYTPVPLNARHKLVREHDGAPSGEGNNTGKKIKYRSLGGLGADDSDSDSSSGSSDDEEDDLSCLVGGLRIAPVTPVS